MFIRREICLAILFVIVNGVFASTCPENKKKICDCKKNDWNQIVLFCQINDSSINIVYEPYRYMKVRICVMCMYLNHESIYNYRNLRACTYSQYYICSHYFQNSNLHSTLKND